MQPLQKGLFIEGCFYSVLKYDVWYQKIDLKSDRVKGILQ
jgi:hypothetical protein